MARLFLTVFLLAQSASSAAEPDGSAVRPRVYALLKDGSYIEGTLQKFDGGVYTVEIDGKARAISERELRSIAFPPPPLPKRRPLTRSFDELMTELRKDPYGGKNQAAIEEYASQGEEGLTILLEAVRKDTGHMSHVAGKVLRQMGHEVLPTLVRIARQEQDANVRAAVRTALGDFAMDALPQIRELMTDRDVKLREMALYLLYNRAIQAGTILPPALEAPLIVALRDESDTVRSNAAHILGRMAHGSKLIVPALVEVVDKDRSSSVATSAISGLLMIARERGPAASDEVAGALARTVESHDDPTVRASAATHLADLGTKADSAIATLRKAAREDQIESVRKAAGTTLRRIGHADLPELEGLGVDDKTMSLIRGLLIRAGYGQDDLRERQTKAIAALQSMGPENLPALMIVVRQDEESAYWNIVADVMGRWGKSAIPRFEKFVHDEHPLVRRAVAHALGKMQVEAMPDFLPVLLDDKDQAVRWSALDSVVELSKRPNPELQKDALRLVARGLADQQMHREYWWRACHRLAEAVPTNPEALPAMLKILKHDASEDHRSTVARDLGTAAVAMKRDDPRFDEILDSLDETLREDASNSVKQYAILGLEVMALHSSEAVTLLEKWSKDSNDAVARVAQEILDRVKDRSDFRPRPRAQRSGG